MEFGEILTALRISLAVSPFAASSNMAIFVARPNGANTRFSRPGAKAFRRKYIAINIHVNIDFFLKSIYHVRSKGEFGIRIKWIFTVTQL
jgi:hypothetical protein